MCDHLGGLPRRGEPGRVAVDGDLPLRLRDAVPDLPHRGEDGLLFLVRGQQGQAGGGGQLDVYAHPVGQQAQPPGEQRVGPRDGLGVDIAAEPVLLPENLQRADHQLRGVVRASDDGGGEK